MNPSKLPMETMTAVADPGTGRADNVAPSALGRTVDGCELSVVVFLYLYGHIWVTLSLALRHPLWGAIALPLRALLYVRQQTMAKIPPRRGWKFATKLELAARLVEWIGPFVKRAGKTLWIVVDGGYTKAPFLKRAAAAGVTIVGRLRKDAALRDLPGKPRRDQSRRRGRPRKYGKHKISLAKRAGHKQGWQELACTIYGQTVAKTCKTFLATSRFITKKKTSNHWTRRFARRCGRSGVPRRLFTSMTARATVRSRCWSSWRLTTRTASAPES